MKYLITAIAAVLLVGCGESQQSTTAPEAKPESATVKVPDISIHEAARDGNIEAVKQHLAAGTEVDEKDIYQATALHKAARKGHKEIAELLIAKGANINEINKYGRTPLDVAKMQKHTKTADLLRKHGGKTAEELKAEGK